MRFPDKKKCPVDHSCTMSTPKELCIDCRVVDSYNLAIDHCRGNFEEYELELKAILYDYGCHFDDICKGISDC